MDLDIITGLPPWYILICIFAGILGSMILYFREKKSEFPVWVKRILGILRFLIIASIAFLLLSPLLKMTTHQVESPLIVIVQDNSNSLVMNKDSIFYRQDYTLRLNELAKSLSEEYEIRLYTFGEQMDPAGTSTYDTLEFNDHQTDISAIFDMMDLRYLNRNIGALLIASDGIYNSGFNPMYRTQKTVYPVYTLALGDTTERRDAYLKRVLHNRIAYEGNDLPLEIIVNASKMNGESLDLVISEAGTTIDRKQVPVNGDRFSKTLRLTFPAGEPGTHHYIVQLSASRDELTKENNRYDLFIDVLRSKQKVLILANSPHPDISAVKEAIKSNINYEVEDVLLSDFSGPLEEYSLVVLHQLPSYSPLSAGIINRLQRANVPLLFILGAQTDLQAFNSMNAGLRLQAFNTGGNNEAQPLLNDGFSSFILPVNLRDQLPALPPLNTVFARYSVTNSSTVLFSQRLGGIESGDPLWLLNEGENRRNGVICGTGIWKWRIRTWMGTGNHDMFNDLVNKNVQYLSMKEDKRRFRVTAGQRSPENQPVGFAAELYNKSFEPFNEPDVKLEVIDEAGNTYNYLFNRNDMAYALEVGGLAVGSYSFRAETKIGDQLFTDEGGFAVTRVIAEQARLKAEHDLLMELAEKNGGQMIRVEEMSGFPDMLKEKGDIKPVLHAERKYIELIDIVWVLVMMIGLLAIEWFLRKWSGSY